MTDVRHLSDIASLPDDVFYSLLEDTAEIFARLQKNDPPKPKLEGCLQFNLFYENSTRTNLSFEVAGKRLGAIVSVVPVQASSVHKGETVDDTVLTLAAQGADAIVLRAEEPGTIASAIAALKSDGYRTSIINAGEGTLGHPTQGLLDVATLLTALGRAPRDGLSDQTLVICGDVAHSRVAMSAIQAFSRLGATVRLCGPADLLPHTKPDGVTSLHDEFTDGLAGASVVMALRLQKERMHKALGMSDADFHTAWGLTHDRLNANAAAGAWVMHPGPMNRGVEVTAALADDLERSLVRSQVTHSVAVRMAVLTHLIGAR